MELSVAWIKRRTVLIKPFMELLFQSPITVDETYNRMTDLFRAVPFVWSFEALITIVIHGLLN